MSREINRREFIKLLGMLPLGLFKWPRMALRNHSGDKHNVLIVVFDALSAKNMSVYGYPRKTTPQIEQRANKAAVFHRHYAGGNFTTPGTASLLTGVYPWSHRAFNLYGRVNEDHVQKSIFSLLGDTHHCFTYSHNSLANNILHQFRDDIGAWTKRTALALASNTYSDRIFSDDLPEAYSGELLLFHFSHNPPGLFLLSQLESFKRLISLTVVRNRYKHTFPRGVPQQSPGDILFTIEQAMDWIEAQVQDAPEPFLGYIHLLPPHEPYNTREDFVDLFDDDWQSVDKPEHFFTQGKSERFLREQRRQYDEYIAYVDAEFGRLYDELEQMGILENTCLILTSDHGEMFERGIHAHTTPILYEPVINIPLLVWHPDQEGRVDMFAPTSCVDVLPTIMELAGQPIPAWCEGMPLPIIDQGSVDTERSIYAVEAKGNHWHAPLEQVTLALIKGRYKLVHYLGYDDFQDVYELYDLEGDPDELNDIFLSLPEIAIAMKEETDRKLEEINHPYQKSSSLLR
jgi:arylsulfatase A-like enzyme